MVFALLTKLSRVLPTDPVGIIARCHPIPPLVHQHIEHVHKLILQAINNVPDVPKEPPQPPQKQAFTFKGEVVVAPDHPYENELLKFKPNKWQLQVKEPLVYPLMENSKLTMVDSKLTFDEMMQKLKKVGELAIDLEHHGYRSFHGMICLVQISTRTEDFIIDALILQNELSRLNEVCTDSKILKVMHGSECDIEWLQRYYGVFVINLFDTQIAARVLREDHIGLGHVLKKYCRVQVNKLHQLADWRIRPLPDDMLQYAIEDAHYLLYIHQVFRNSLLKSEDGEKKLLDVYAASVNVCGTLYKGEAFQPDSYLACYKKTKGKLNVQQLECFRLLYEWRYKISMEMDESTGYTLPNKMMMKIALELPSEADGIIAIGKSSPVVMEHVEDILKLICQAIKNVPEVPEEPVVEGKNAAKKKEERLLAIKMVNELFLEQMRKHPEACRLLLKKFEKGRDALS